MDREKQNFVHCLKILGQDRGVSSIEVELKLIFSHTTNSYNEDTAT